LHVKHPDKISYLHILKRVHYRGTYLSYPINWDDLIMAIFSLRLHVTILGEVSLPFSVVPTLMHPKYLQVSSLDVHKSIIHGMVWWEKSTWDFSIQDIHKTSLLGYMYVRMRGSSCNLFINKNSFKGYESLICIFLNEFMKDY
jgi:hypothetical protein